jgi:hypothetical protein
LSNLAKIALSAVSVFLAMAGACPALARGRESPAPTARYLVRYDHWSKADERAYGDFISAIGHSDCRTVDGCLHSPANPFRASDKAGAEFRSDCADLPYVLRFYFAWKRGLPFGYVSAVEPRGPTRDYRYTARGNVVARRADARDAGANGYAIIHTLRDAVSSATYRIDPDLEVPEPPDLYSPAISQASIRPGTVIYDPNGHLAVVYEIGSDGRIHFIDAHPDNVLTRGVYDQRFVRSSPGIGAGFKNWRPMRLVGATRDQDGSLTGGSIDVARNNEIDDFSDEQYFGNGHPPHVARAWRGGTFSLNGEQLDYYDYVRAKVAGDRLAFDPLREVRDMVDANCADLHYRAQAVSLAIAAGIADKQEPGRLPAHIFAVEGEWASYATSSRDARLKTAFKELRDRVERFMRLSLTKDPHLRYGGKDLPADMLGTYERTAARCTIEYVRSNGSTVALGYEEARRRLFLMSFDPYHCVERRWGATDPRELSSCADGRVKRAWYVAEQSLRDQIDGTFDTGMGFALGQLSRPGFGKAMAEPPDIDTRAYLTSMTVATRPGFRPGIPKTLQPCDCRGKARPALTVGRKAPRGER